MKKELEEILEDIRDLASDVEFKVCEAEEQMSGDRFKLEEREDIGFELERTKTLDDSMKQDIPC